MKNFSFCVAETAFMEGYKAVDAWLKSNKLKRNIRKCGKKTAETNHGWADQLRVKPNRWSEYKNCIGIRIHSSFPH